MAKSTTTRTRRPHPADTQADAPMDSAPVAEKVDDRDDVRPESRADTRAPDRAPDVSEDVASFDAETNAKYEQVKGGKLYIKDLQQMDVVSLHDIAKQEGIVDFAGMKKQDL